MVINKILKIILILTFAFISLFFLTEFKTEAIVSLYPETITIEYGQEYLINKDNFIQEIIFTKNGYQKTKDEIVSGINFDASNLQYEDKLNYLKVGEYDIQYFIVENNPIIYTTFKDNISSIKLVVQDTISPKVTLLKPTLIWEKGETLTEDDINNCFTIDDLSNTKIQYDIGKININQLGKQDLNIIVSDNYDNKTNITLNINIVKKIKSQDSLFNQDGNISNFTIYKANNIYNRFPSKIKTILEKNGWTYYITEHDINKRYYNGELQSELAGLTINSEKKVYISSKYLYEGLLHECGHVIDYELGGLSSSEEFNTIYKSEKESFSVFDTTKSSYYLSSPSECFAELVEIMIENPSMLKNKCPFLYNYIHNILNSEEVINNGIKRNI